MNQGNFLLGYEVITMIITTKENSFGTNFNQENWMLVIWLIAGKSLPVLYTEKYWVVHLRS